jgi:hypothetical protein
VLSDAVERVGLRIHQIAKISPQHQKIYVLPWQDRCKNIVLKTCQYKEYFLEHFGTEVVKQPAE